MAAEDQFSNPFSSKIARLAERRQALLLAFGAFVVVFFLWQVSGSSPILFPFRLLVTFVHESGHGLAAILTSGTFYSFEIYGNGAGVAFTGGGNPLVVI